MAAAACIAQLTQYGNMLKQDDQAHTQHIIARVLPCGVFQGTLC